MAVTLEEVQDWFARDELDYPALAKQAGPSVMPILQQLVESPDPLIAGKAVSLAGEIGGVEATGVIERAASHAHVGPRAVAASAAARLPQASAERVILKLLEDAQPSVAKFAVRSAVALKTPVLRTKLQALAKIRTQPAFARELARALEALR